MAFSSLTIANLQRRIANLPQDQRFNAAIALAQAVDLASASTNNAGTGLPVTGLQGPAGAPGDQGLPGARGARGAQGAAGPRGPQGVPGPTGEQGLRGAPGSQGPQGPRGQAGEAGEPGIAGPAGTSPDPSEIVALVIKKLENNASFNFASKTQPDNGGAEADPDWQTEFFEEGIEWLKENARDIFDFLVKRSDKVIQDVIQDQETTLNGLEDQGPDNMTSRNVEEWLREADVAVNESTGGSPGTTISYRCAMDRASGGLVGAGCCSLLDLFDPGHCEGSIKSMRNLYIPC